MGLVEGQNGAFVQVVEGTTGNSVEALGNEPVGPRVVKCVGHMGVGGDSAATVLGKTQKARFYMAPQAVREPGPQLKLDHRNRDW